MNQLDTLIAGINDDLATILQWSRSFGLTVNPNKSQVIIIGGSKQIARLVNFDIPPITFDGVVLPYSNVVKNLGVLFDSTLSWTNHIAEVSRKVFAAMGSLRRWKNLLPVKTKVELAQSLIFPILDYADICLIDLNEVLLNKLQRLQNLCIRFVYGLRKFDHVSAFRSKLKWLPIRLRRDERVLSLLFNVLHDPRSPPYLKECFQYRGDERNYALRCKSDNLLTTPLARSGYYLDSFTIKSTHLWNALPSDIRYSESLAIFKRKLHNHLLANSMVCR